MQIASTPEIIEEIRAGRMVVLMDEEDRENEGDLLMAADFVTPEAINFMTKYGRGLVCLTLTEERCKRLNLSIMSNSNGTAFGTNFTVSIEAARGVTTGISAGDRARTIQAAIAPNATPADIVQPGHMFPLMARRGGVLTRAGHTEAGCDLTDIAGLTPAAVICEILKDDGTMAGFPDLVEFVQKHGLKIGTVADLIQYRSRNESIIERIESRTLRTAHGDFAATLYGDKPTGSAHLALTHGAISAQDETLVRVHQPVSMIDLLETDARGHSWSVSDALTAIRAARSSGVVLLMNCAETTEGFIEQFQSQSYIASTPAKMDVRTHGVGAQILRDLGVGKMRLMSSPRKLPSMAGFGLEVVGFQPAPATNHNLRTLSAANE